MSGSILLRQRRNARKQVDMRLKRSRPQREDEGSATEEETTMGKYAHEGET